MRIVITDADTVVSEGISLKVFEKFGRLTVYPLTTPDELEERIKDADIVLCNKTLMTADVLSGVKNLKYIGLFATGYNNIDLSYTSTHHITVCNVPDYSTEAVAQHTFAFILALYNRVGEYNQSVKQGDWMTSPTFSYFPMPLCELKGKIIGIVGYGSIGRRVADIAKAFGMKVLVHNRHTVKDDTVSPVSLDQLLSSSDIVTLHCPLNDDSRGMMNEEAFGKMKEGALFINTARGPIVDETALCHALKSKKLLGAGLDVLCREPMSADCPLFGVENCLITPHIAWAAVETRKRLVNAVAENIAAFLNGSPIHTVKP